MWRAYILRPVFPFAVESRDDLGMRIGQIVHLGAVGGDVVEMPRAIGLAPVPRPLGHERDEFPAPVENAARAVMLEEERRVALALLPLEHAGDRDAVDRQIGRAHV